MIIKDAVRPSGQACLDLVVVLGEVVGVQRAAKLVVDEPLPAHR